jgi:hypothetical protein
MTKKDQMAMIRSLFNIMIHGVSHDRLVVLMDEALKNGGRINKKTPGGSKNH